MVPSKIKACKIKISKVIMIFFPYCLLLCTDYVINIWDKWPFTNYIDTFLAFFDPLTPFVDSFYLIKVDIFGLSTYFFLKT